MNDDLSPFLQHALSDEFANQVAEQLNPDDWKALLLWQAHRKRIRRVPMQVLAAAVIAFRNGIVAVDVQIENANDVHLVMDKVGELVWNTLDEAGRREWLLKV